VICIPAGVEHIGPAALPWESLESIVIEAGNHHFSVSESRFLISEGISILGCVGVVTELTVPNTIEELGGCCFCFQTTLSVVSFESDSRVQRFRESAFSHASVRSIVIPSSVEIIETLCFLECRELSMVRFEANSRLSDIGAHAFGLCPLETVWIPSCIETVAIGHFGYVPDVRLVVLETGATVTPLPKHLLRNHRDLCASFLGVTENSEE
jgi:hypothetical protein